jgi:hypothetical protein
MDPDPAIFVFALQDANNKLIFFLLVRYFIKVHLHQFYKIKSHIKKRRHKTVGIKVFLTMLDDPDPYFSVTDPGGPKTYRSSTLVTGSELNKMISEDERHNKL